MIRQQEVLVWIDHGCLVGMLALRDSRRRRESMRRSQSGVLIQARFEMLHRNNADLEEVGGCFTAILSFSS
jgi:hypothetical protein